MFNYYKIVRKNYGWYKRRFGIIFNTLNPHHQKLLKENRFIKKYSDDDNFVQILFRISDMEQQNKNLKSFWYNPVRDEVTTKKDIHKAHREVEWNCAICKEDIVSTMDNFNTENFLCLECKEAFANTETVDERIKDSSVAFTQYCKTLLKREQKEYMLYVKRNKNRC